MSNETISILDLAKQSGKRKQTIFKVVLRLNIKATKQRDSRRRGQMVACVTTEEGHRILAELKSRAPIGTLHTQEPLEMQVRDGELGVFYLIALEPEHDTGRFKVGFTMDMAERLRDLRCSAPLLRLLKQWPCKRLWEKTAIDAVTRGCEQIHTEVFRTSSIDAVAGRCEQFFLLLPGIGSRRP